MKCKHCKFFVRCDSDGFGTCTELGYGISSHATSANHLSCQYFVKAPVRKIMESVMMHTGIKAKEICTEILEKMDHSINADPLYPAYLGDTGYFVENGKYVAFDNTFGDCWMEEFKTKAQAENWINGEEAAK